MTSREPPIPGLVCGAVQHRGRKALLSIFVTAYHDEGTCLFELLNPDNTMHAVDNGSWRIVSHDRGNVLDVDIPDQDMEGWHELLDQLMAQIVKGGAALGIDAFLPQGDQN